jgi:hypothetical protein
MRLRSVGELLTTERSSVMEIGWLRRRPLHRLSYDIRLLWRGIQRVGYSRGERAFIGKRNCVARIGEREMILLYKHTYAIRLLKRRGRPRNISWQRRLRGTMSLRRSVGCQV